MRNNLSDLTEDLMDFSENAPDDLPDIINRYVPDEDDIVDMYLYRRPDGIINWSPESEREEHFIDIVKNVQGELYFHTDEIVFAYAIYDDNENAFHQIPLKDIVGIDYFNDKYLDLFQMKRSDGAFILWGSEAEKEDFIEYSQSISESWQEAVSQ